MNEYECRYHFERKECVILINGEKWYSYLLNNSWWVEKIQDNG